jgi:hypothetical protein
MFFSLYDDRSEGGRELKFLGNALGEDLHWGLVSANAFGLMEPLYVLASDFKIRNAELCRANAVQPPNAAVA